MIIWKVTKRNPSRNKIQRIKGQKAKKKNNDLTETVGPVHEYAIVLCIKQRRKSQRKTLDRNIFIFQPFVLRKPVGTGQGGDVESGFPGEGQKNLRSWR